jgi:hypothetical protein
MTVKNLFLLLAEKHLLLPFSDWFDFDSVIVCEAKLEPSVLFEQLKAVRPRRPLMVTGSINFCLLAKKGAVSINRPLLIKD